MLKIDAISVAYGDRCVVDHFSLQLKQGEIGVCWGPVAAVKRPCCALWRVFTLAGR